MKYLVTDPCYLLHMLDSAEEQDNLWSFVCGKDFMKDSDQKDASKRMSDVLGVNILRISDTGYGDWSNSITSCSKHIKVLSPEFYADAGMMCVVEINEKLENYLKEHDIGAIFESDEPIAVDVDCSDRSWYVLKITDLNGRYDYAASEESEEDDLFDEEYWYEDDEDDWYEEYGYEDDEEE